ncbi:MAG: DUF1150 family protein [Pseudomonadota bacterium]
MSPIQSQIPSQVYIREADWQSMPPEIRGQDIKVYAVHDAESGAQLALAADRQIAFALARRNDMTPLSVH